MLKDKKSKRESWWFDAWNDNNNNDYNRNVKIGHENVFGEFLWLLKSWQLYYWFVVDMM